MAVYGLNTAGQILGYLRDSTGVYRSVLRSLDGREWTEIAVPGASETFASGLNNRGEVVGSYTDREGIHSFLRTATGTYNTFDIPGPTGAVGTKPTPRAVNDYGDMAGRYSAGGLVEDGFFLSADRTTLAVIQAAAITQAAAINNAREIVGTLRIGGSYRLHHGFLWKPDGSIRLIDMPGGSLETSVVALNNRGQMVANGVVLNRDGSSSAPDPTFGGTVLAIDDSGRLVGTKSEGGVYRGFLATPIDAPQPVIRPVRGVISASAFGGLETIAPGSWIEIYGSKLSEATRPWTAADFLGDRAPTALEGVSVTVNGRPAYVSYVSPGQVNAQVPSDLTPGPAQVVVTRSGQRSTGYRTTVAATAPGLMAIAGDVVYTAAVALYPDFKTYALPDRLYDTVPPFPPVPTRRAKPGDTLILYGIGFGGVNPAVGAGQIAATQNAIQGNLEILVSGLPAKVMYAGLAPGTVGLYQFNVIVPEGVFDPAPLQIRLNGSESEQRKLYLAVAP